MSRISIDLPQTFSFSARIPIRITDLNYGGHVGNDTVLSLIHEARMQYLKQRNLSELDFGGVGLIMRDVAIEFKRELFYGDVLLVSVAAGELEAVSFGLYYQLKNESTGQVVSIARTGMVCYHYGLKKIARLPEQVRPLLI